MLWRNLLFLGLVVTAVGGLVFTLYPRSLPPSRAHFDPHEAEQPEFAGVVKNVDAAIRQSWTDYDPENPIQPAPPADKLAVARRLSLTLVGTIPSLQEIRQIEARKEANPLAWYVAHLLEDRRHSDYWAERLARTYVGTENGPFVVYRRRRFVSWISDELHKNHPYDHMVRELIADTGLWTDSPATNFITVTIELDNKKGPNPERLAGRVSRAFLGVRLDCAQCHNHPFEKWTQNDFQGLSAMFAQTHQGFTGIYDDKGEFIVENRKKELGGKIVREQIDPGVPFFPELLPEHGTRRERLAAWVTHPDNVYFARATVNRVWALMFGRGLVEPLDDMTSSGKAPAPVQILADDLVKHHFDLRRLIKIIAATEAFHRDSAAEHELTDVHERFWAAFPMTRLRPEQVAGSVIQAGLLETVNQDSSVLTRLTRFGQENEFVERYGDMGEDEFDGRGGTIPQRLLMLNGDLVKERTKNEGLYSAVVRLAALAPTDAKAVEAAYLTVLSRRPTPEELDHFTKKLIDKKGDDRSRQMEDICWTLLNATEFSWNH